MATHLRWNSYNDVNEHLEDSILLAYLRGQELEIRSRVIQHIEIEKCPVCLQKLNDLKQVSTTLDILGEMRSYQSYPELSAVDTYAHIQRVVNRQMPTKAAMDSAKYRQHARSSVIRLISLPAAFGLAILFTMVMLVFANLSGRPFNPFSSIRDTSHSQHMLTVEVPPHAISNQQANLTATEVVTQTGVTETKEPYIKVCSMQANSAQLRLVICGFHFDSERKATLFVYMSGKRHFSTQILVDKHGKFQIGWNFTDCGNVPTIIYGYQETSSKSIFVKLQITSSDSCPVPSTTPIVKPRGVFTKFDY